MPLRGDALLKVHIGADIVLTKKFLLSVYCRGSLSSICVLSWFTVWFLRTVLSHCCWSSTNSLSVPSSIGIIRCSTPSKLCQTHRRMVIDTWVQAVHIYFIVLTLVSGLSLHFKNLTLCAGQKSV